MLGHVELLMAGFGTIAAILAIVNGVQAVLGRPLIAASRSRRSPARRRRESLAAAIAMAGASLAAVTVWRRWAATVGMASILLGRARSS
jgi:hypothetical protein